MKISFSLVRVVAVVVGVATLVVGGVRGDTKTTEKVEDYGAGFRAFAAFGMPVLSKASYGELTQSDPLDYSNYDNFDIYEVKLKGNAWRLPSTAEAKESSFMMLKGVVKEAVLGMDKVAGETHWQECDLDSDLDKAIAYVKKKLEQQASLKEGDDQFSQMWMQHDSFVRSQGGQGTLFLLATAAWQNGAKDKANELAGALFRLAGDNRKVIMAAVNVMADAQLEGVGGKVQRTGEWKVAQEEVAVLLKRYQTGWRLAPVASKLEEQLQKRVNWQEEPLQGEGLSDLDQELAKALVTIMPEHARHNMPPLWFLDADSSANKEDESKDPVDRIMARGLDSLPLLLALAKDDLFTCYGRFDLGMRYRMSSRDSEPLKNEEEILAVYNNLYRPQSRGEIARKLLILLCNKEKMRTDDYGVPDTDEVVAVVEEQLKTIRELSRDQQAIYFIESGDSEQRVVALNFLLKSKEADKYIELIENTLLKSIPRSTAEQDNQMRYYDFVGDDAVASYVRKRGEAATGFVERYLAALSEAAKPSDLANDGMLKEMLKHEALTLRSLASKADIDEVIRRLSVEKGFSEEDVFFVGNMLPRIPMTNALTGMLQAAVKATNLTAKARILGYCSMIVGLRREGADDVKSGKEPQDAESAKRLIRGSNEAFWKELLTDKRVSQADKMNNNYTIADHTVMAVERICNPDFFSEWYGYADSLGSLLLALEVLHERANSRLAGKSEAELPEMPTAADVSADRGKELLAALSGAGADKVAQICTALSAAETLFLQQELADNKELQQTLTEPSRRITMVKTEVGTAPPLPEILAKAKGSMLSTNMVAAMRSYCLEALKQGQPLAVSLKPEGFGRGLRLNVVAIDSDSEGLNSTARRMRSWLGSAKELSLDGIVVGWLIGGEQGSARGEWVVESQKPRAKAGAAEDADDDHEDMLATYLERVEDMTEGFEKGIDELCKSGKPLETATLINFTGILFEEVENEQ